MGLDEKTVYINYVELSSFLHQIQGWSDNLCWIRMPLARHVVFGWSLCVVWRVLPTGDPQADNMYMDRDSQIAAIEKTFEDVKKPVLKHYSKPGVTAVAEMPVFPDFDVCSADKSLRHSMCLAFVISPVRRLLNWLISQK